MTTARICEVEPFRYQATPQPVGDQGASSNQINEQSLEDYLSRMRVALCADIQALLDAPPPSTIDEFIELEDTPDSYTGDEGKLVAVNSAEDALEFWPPTFSGQANKMVVVKNAEDGFELQDQPVLPTYFLTPRLTQAWPPQTANPFGTAVTATNGAAVAIPTNPADALAASLRFSFTAAAALNSNAIGRSAVFQCTRGTAAPIGGFKLRWRFGLTQYAAGARCFIGLWNSIAAQPFTTADPSNLTNVFFLGFDDTDTTWQIMHNDNTLTCTKVDTTETIAINKLYELVISASPGASSIDWELHNLQDGTSFGGNVSTNLPQDTIPLTPAMQIGSAASGAQNRLDHVLMFLETGPEP